MTFRIAIIDFVFFAGLSIGSGIAGRVNEYLGYKGIYFIGFVCQLSALIYGILAIHEKKKDQVSASYFGNNVKQLKSPFEFCGKIFYPDG